MISHLRVKRPESPNDCIENGTTLRTMTRYKLYCSSAYNYHNRQRLQSTKEQDTDIVFLTYFYFCYHS